MNDFMVMQAAAYRQDDIRREAERSRAARRPHRTRAARRRAPAQAKTATDAKARAWLMTAIARLRPAAAGKWQTQ